MKKTSLFIAALVLMASCNNTPKKATKATEIPAPQETKVNIAKQFSPTDYQMFLGAAFENQDSIVKAKIAEGIDVNYADEGKWTALMYAGYNGHTDIVEMLLDAGANVNMVNATNRSALMFASTGPFPETVKLLLQAGADVNAKDSHESWTPVMFAAGEGQLEILKILIAAGGDITMVDVDGESSYDFAVSGNHAATANYLKNLAQKNNN